jgi:hypothetical protein
MAWQSINPSIKLSKILAIAINVLTMPFTVIFNAFVIFSVIKDASFRKERLIVIACLAVADVFHCGLVCQPLFVAKEIYYLKYTELNCKLENAFYLCRAYILVGASFSQLLIVTYERYVAVIQPYKYPTRITTRKLIYATVAVWIEIIFETILYFSYPFSSQKLMYANLGVTVTSFLGFGFIIYTYVRIALVVRRHRLQIETEQQNVASISQNNHTRLRKGSSLSAGILVGFLFVTYAPLHVSCGLVSLYENKIRTPLFFFLLPLTEKFILLNSFINPIIYCLRTRRNLNRNYRDFWDCKTTTLLQPWTKM